MTPDPEVRLIAARTHGRVLIGGAADAAAIVLGFHGYMESAETQLQRLRELPGADRWILVSIQALHRVYRGRSQEVVASWMTRQDRDTAIADNLAYVDAVVERVRREYAAGALPVACVGFSQGGAMAFRAGVRGSFGARAIASVGADVPPELLADVSLRFPDVLLARGRDDEWLTRERFDADAARLAQRGCRVRALTCAGGHGWTTAVGGEVGTFLTEALKSA